MFASWEWKCNTRVELLGVAAAVTIGSMAELPLATAAAISLGQLRHEMFCLLSPKKRLKCVYERASPQNRNSRAF
jgi:hypothetical protein